MKRLALSLFIFVTGCSTCDFVFDPFGPGKSYCFAKEAQRKNCTNRGGPMPNYTISPMSFCCADKTCFEGYKNDWAIKKEVVSE